jgi:autotransporter-associated beta strand protein
VADLEIMKRSKNQRLNRSKGVQGSARATSAWVAAALLAGAPGSAWSDIIAYNFSENPGNQGLDTTTPKGPTGTSVWNDNNVRTSGDLANGTETGLVDDSNTATSASIAWSSSNVWWNGSGTGDEERRVLVGYLDDGGAGVSVTVENIPYAAYNVYGIIGSDQGNEYTTRDFQVNGVWALGGTAATTAPAYGTWDAAGSTWTRIVPGASPVRGNYWKIEGVVGSTLTIQGQPRNGSDRGCLSAIIIEEASFSAPSSFDKPGLTSLPAAALGSSLTSIFRPGLDTVTLTDPNGLTAAATHSVQVVPLPGTASGTYTLFDYDGTLGGDGFSALQVIPPANTRYGYALVDNTVDGKVDLAYTAPEPVLWTGATDDLWDASTANWKLETAGTPTSFQDLDIVKFTDVSGSPAETVDVLGTVTPISLLVDNSATAFTIGGAGSIAGSGTFTKQGTGTVTLAGANSFTGAITVLGGTVNAAAAGSLGAGSAPLTLDGGTLAASASFSSSRALTTGFDGSTVEVAAGETLGFSSGFKGGNTLTKTGDGVLAFSGYGATSFSGSLIIDAGVVSMGGGAFNGNIGVSSITVAGGATLLQPAGAFHALGGYFAPVPAIDLQEGSVYQINQENYLDSITLTGATVQGAGQARVDDGFSASMLSSESVSIWSAELNTVVKDAYFFVEDGTLETDGVISGNIVGDNGFRKDGPGTLEISGGSNTYVGNTSVLAGTLRLGTASALPGPVLTVDSGATLDVAGRELPWAVLSSQTLTGGGSITGDTDVDGTLAPGSPLGTLAFADTLTLFGGSTYRWQVGSWSATALAGTDYDTVTTGGFGTLNTGGNPITLTVLPENLADFTEESRTFTLLQSATPFTFNAADYTVDASAFTTATGALGTWSLQSGVNSLQLVYTAGSPGGYAAWAATQGFASGEDGPDFDADADGIDNAIEWVIGGDPTDSPSNALAPTVTVGASTVTYVFRRTDDSAAANPFVEYGSNLSGWTEAETGVDGVSIAETADGFGPGIDRVEVTIPRALAVGGTLFVRLRVDVP